MRNIAHEGLKEENEADPLIPCVPHFVALFSDSYEIGIVGIKCRVQVVHWSDSRMGHFCANLSGDLGRDGESAVNPAVGVHYA